MPQISFLLKTVSLTSQNLKKKLICDLANMWPNEFKRLCQPMKNSPSVLHDLVNITEEELPSSVLFQNRLLFNEYGKIKTINQYDRKAYVELNRGMSAAIALLNILRGDSYEELVQGQKKETALTKDSYLQLHEQFKDLFQKNKNWDEQLLETIFYAVLFNDLGKSIELKRVLHDVYKMKENDHDLILYNAMKIEGLLEDFSMFHPFQKQCLRAMWHSGFNPSSFDTLEYPLSLTVHWVMSFANIVNENTSLYLAMKKIEILTDIAGVNGHHAKGAINLTEPVITKFNKSFAILNQLIEVYQQQVNLGVKNYKLIYTAILQKLKELLLEQAKELKITTSNQLAPRTVLKLRICKMLGINDPAQTNMVNSVLNKIELQNPDQYQILEREFSWTLDPIQTILWLECIPKFLWLMSNGNNYDLIAHDSLPNSASRLENGLYAGLLIVSKILQKIRNDNKYEDQYTFENNELVRISLDIAKPSVDQTRIALFVAYDLVRVAQQASLSNPNLEERQEAVNCLKTLWEQGVLIVGRSITINKAPRVKNQITKANSFFDTNQIPNEFVIEQQQKWLELLSKETSEHCAYLASNGLADRANYFKVRNYIYRDVIPGTIDINRFGHHMALPEIVSTFNTQEKNTLFSNADSTAKDQEQEIKRTLDIRLYPAIKRIIEEQGAKLFLGSTAELQVYASSIKEKLIIEIEIPSSVKFYLSLNHTGDIKVYIAGLVSYENLIQQLMTLKLAGIDPQTIPILGDTQHFKSVCKDDLSNFQKQASAYLEKRNVLIVAGCHLEDTVCTTLEQIFVSKMSKKKFTGNLVSLTYVQSPNAPRLGFIVLNLNYGETCEEQISTILEKFNCIGVFASSAAGYIPKDAQEKLPEIGSRLPVQCARHFSNEVVSLGKETKPFHLQVPTIFVETFSWLKNARELGATTVDVETFYILKALQKYQRANPHATIHADIGVFISDYVGEKPLRSYHNVFAQYPLVLQNFVKQVLVANITASYNNNRTSVPAFSPDYFGLTPEKIKIDLSTKREAVVDSIGKCWDKSEFSKRVHTPVTIGTVKNKENFTAHDVPRCIHLPIKFPCSAIRIPIEYRPFADELQQIFNFEVSINPGMNEMYAYLTVDQGFVPRSKSQRVPGPHVDGMPRDRNNPEKQLIDHAYLVTNAIPTMFYTQQFDMKPFDPKIHHFFAIFRALSDESRTITVKPFDISLMNAYSVHTPTQTLEDVNRTFIRLEFSTLKFDRVGNSINPHFSSNNGFPEYPFTYIPRPIPEQLFVPPSVYVNKPITNEDYSHESIDSFGRANLQAIFTQNSKFILKHSDYKNLDIIANDMMNEKTQGIVLSYQGTPHAFCLYQIENRAVKLDTLFTLAAGKGQEMMIYAMKLLNKVSDRLSIQSGLEEGATPISIVVNENNEDMLRYFLRAARLAKLEVNIERPEQKPSIQNVLPITMRV